ncbi:hypothetical protein D3C87_2066200 [compost metagenome]
MVPQLPSLDESIEIMGGMVRADDTPWPMFIVGTPEWVKATLARMTEETGITEFMIQDFLDDPAIRLRNYELLAKAFAL